MADLPDGFRPDDPTAPDRAETYYVKAGFKLTEHNPTHPPTAEPWIMVEMDSPGMVALTLPDGFLGLECRPGVTMEQASKLRQDLDRLVEGVLFTKWLT